MKQVHLGSWGDFEASLRAEVAQLGRGNLVVARNFMKVTFSPDGDEQDRLQTAIDTGTDRDTDSSFWNAGGFDHEHDINPAGKAPNEIIYAFTLDLSQTPYLVPHGAVPEAFDITKSLTEHNAIIVYDASMLDRKSMNEYWFKGDPRDAALLVYTAEEPGSQDALGS